MGVVRTVGESLRDLLATIESDPKVYFGDPGFEGIDELPAIVVGVPAGSRRNPDEPEDHLGQTDWHLDYPVAIICDLGIAAESQELAIQILEQSVDVIDQQQDDLDSRVLDAVFASWEIPEVAGSQKRALLTLSGNISVLAFT